jgi:hypothetical protein
MRRHWKRALLLVLVCVLLGLLAWTVLRPPSPAERINSEVYERIEEGMTPAEVEALIGLPPGDYRVDPASPRHRAEFLPKKGVAILEWEADDCNIQVRVDESSGRVIGKIFGEPLSSSAHNFWKRLRGWAGW